MNKKRLFLLMLAFAFLFVLISNTSAQTLPAKVKTYLDKNYSGWKMTGFDKACPSETKRYTVEGDFNGDKKRDYAVKFAKGRSGYIIAFIAEGTNYKALVLRSEDASVIRSTGLGVARKGEKYAPDVDSDNPRLVRLKNDAIYTNLCESEGVRYYIYQNGRFQ